MKQIKITSLKRSVIIYISVAMFVLAVIIAFHTYFIQNNILYMGDMIPHSYLLFGMVSSAILMFLLFIVLIYRRISLYQEEVYNISREHMQQIHHTHQLLMETQSDLKDIFNTVPNIMIITDGSQIKKANQAMLDFFGYKNVNFFMQEHDCVCDYFLKEKDCVVADMNGISWLEYILFNQNRMHKVCMFQGTTKHYFTVNAKKLYKDFTNHEKLVIFNDITELETLKERYEYAIDGSNDGLWDWNLESGALYLSPRWKKMLGYEEYELKNSISTWEFLVHPDDVDKAEKAFTENIEGKTDHYENIHRLKHKDGHWVWILDRGNTIFNEESKAIRMVGFHTDISQTKELEQELRKKDEIMIAQSRHAAMGEMISMIAHQWRQPLSVIAMGGNNILADIELEILDTQTLKDGVKDILKQTQELSETINDFRNFFKSDKEKQEVLIENVFVEALAMIGKSLQNNTIEVENIFDSTTKISIYARELKQVFINLLNNAKESLLETKQENRKITNKIYEIDESVIVEICDNGAGFNQEVLKKIFEPYFSTKNEKNGTGLGLYMSKIIIEEHLKGKLGAKNSTDGAVMTIQLPKSLNHD
ncbi:MAG: PAS domain-containing protein [Campylobacterales bacterium]|nr:PAS domain-containing protein [Campylobacterales bacterium]